MSSEDSWEDDDYKNYNWTLPEKKEIELKINSYDKNLNLNINRLISYNKSKAKQLSLRIINPRKLVENNILKLENILYQFFKTIKFQPS